MRGFGCFFRFNVLLLILFCFCFSASAAVESIERLHPDGVIELKNGGRVRLAGIKPTIEGLRLLAALLSSGVVDIEYDAQLQASGNAVPAYLRGTTREMPFPFGQGASPREHSNDIQEFLLRHGAARVDENAAFKRKARYLELEAEARARGEGLWSYDAGPVRAGANPAA